MGDKMTKVAMRLMVLVLAGIFAGSQSHAVLQTSGPSKEGSEYREGQDNVTEVFDGADSQERDQTQRSSYPNPTAGTMTIRMSKDPSADPPVAKSIEPTSDQEKYAFGKPHKQHPLASSGPVIKKVSGPNVAQNVTNLKAKSKSSTSTLSVRSSGTA